MSTLSEHLANVVAMVEQIGTDAEQVAARFVGDVEGHLRTIEAHLTAILAGDQTPVAAAEPAAEAEPTPEAEAEPVVAVESAPETETGPETEAAGEPAPTPEVETAEAAVPEVDESSASTEPSS